MLPPTVYSIPTPVSYPLFVEKPYITPFHWCPENNFGVNHVYQDLFSKSINNNKVDKHNKVDKFKKKKNRMKIKILNSKIMHKSKKKKKKRKWWGWSEVYFLISFFTFSLHMTRYHIHVTLAQVTTQNILYIFWSSKYKIFFDKLFTTVIHIKNIQSYYNEKK